MIDVEDERRVGLVRIPHPDPQKTIAFMDRIGPYAGDMRDLFNTRNPRAGAGAVKGQAMIATFHSVTLDAAHRQRQLAVWAGVFKRGDIAIGLAIKHDLFAKHLYREQVFANLVVPSGDIPAVA